MGAIKKIIYFFIVVFIIAFDSGLLGSYSMLACVLMGMLHLVLFIAFIIMCIRVIKSDENEKLLRVKKGEMLLRKKMDEEKKN